MDEADGAVALTAGEEWVLLTLLVRPANLALNILVFLCDTSVYFNYFFLIEVFFLLVATSEFYGGFVAIGVALDIFGAVVADEEFETAHFDGVAFVESVLGAEVVLLFGGLVFAVADNNEHLLSLFSVMDCIVFNHNFSVFFLDRKHRLSLRENLLNICSFLHKLDFVVDPNDFTHINCLNIFLANVS